MQRSLFISATLSGASILVGLFSVASAEAATLTHLYQLNNTLTDSLGGSSLMSNGGTFGANQGPSLSNAVNADN